jgi:hypothetical protein
VRSKLPAPTRANEITGAADNNVDFVATMRYLDRPPRRVEFHGEGAVVGTPRWNVLVAIPVGVLAPLRPRSSV